MPTQRLITVNVECSDNNHLCLFPDPCKIEIDTASDDIEVLWHNAASDIK